MKPARLIFAILGIILLLMFLPVAALSTNTGAVIRVVPLGWWHFLERNIPQITYDRGLIATGILCSAAGLLLVNWLMCAMFNQFRATQGVIKSPLRWRWSWSVSLYATIWILFLINCGSAGLWQHIKLLLNSRQPWYEERLNSYVVVRSADSVVQNLMLEHDGNLEKVRKAVTTEYSYSRPRDLLIENFDI